MIQTKEKNTHNQTYIETPVTQPSVTQSSVTQPSVEVTPSSSKSETITKLQFVKNILPEILKKNPNLSLCPK
jgi:hypothetical protein